MADASLATPLSSASSTSPPPKTNENCSMDESTPPATHHAIDSTNVERDAPLTGSSTSTTAAVVVVEARLPLARPPASSPASRRSPALEDIANPAHASRTPTTDPTISCVVMSAAENARGKTVPMHTICAMTMLVPSAMPTLLMAWP